MMATEKNDNGLSYFVVIHGISADTFERLADRFGCRRGGTRLTDASRYMSVPVELDSLNATLTWIATEVPSCYNGLIFLVTVAAKSSWSEVIIPSEIALLAGQYDAAIKVVCSQFKFL
jgi:hypothetical protein